jgi:hypothetical protein
MISDEQLNYFVSSVNESKACSLIIRGLSALNHRNPYDDYDSFHRVTFRMLSLNDFEMFLLRQGKPLEDILQEIAGFKIEMRRNPNMAPSHYITVIWRSDVNYDRVNNFLERYYISYI